MEGLATSDKFTRSAGAYARCARGCFAANLNKLSVAAREGLLLEQEVQLFDVVRPSFEANRFKIT